MAQSVRQKSMEHAPDVFTEVTRLFPQLNRFFDGGEGTPWIQEGFIPQGDVEETEDAYLVEIELPGVKKRDIDISLTGRHLVVTGERQEKERVGVLRRRTRSVGRFRYEVLLPGTVDEDGVTASLDEGVLTVRVPKASAERPRKIEVK